MPTAILTPTSPVTGLLPDSSVRIGYDVPVVNGIGYEIVLTGDERVSLLTTPSPGTIGGDLPRVVEFGIERAWLPPWMLTGTATAGVTTNYPDTNLPYTLTLNPVVVPHLSVDVSYDGVLTQNGDYQWYSIDLTAGQGYIISIIGPDGAVDFAYTAESRLIPQVGYGGAGDYAGIGTSADYMHLGPVFEAGTPGYNATAGRYFVEIGSFLNYPGPQLSFDYTLTVSSRPYIPLVYESQVSDSLAHPGDRDWYTVSLPQAAGMTYVAIAEGQGPVGGGSLTYLEISAVETTGEYIGRGMGELEAPMAISGDLAHDLVIEVGSSSTSTGAYGLRFYTEVGGTTGTAGQAVLGQEIAGDIDYVYDRDAYGITLGAGSYTVYMYDLTSGYPPRLDVLDAAGNVVAEGTTVFSSVRQQGTSAINLTVATEGRYFLRVTQIPDSDSYFHESYGLQIVAGIVDLIGTVGDDVLRATAPGQTLHGQWGNDTLIGTSGSDTLRGGAGDNVMYLGGGADAVLPGCGSLTGERVVGFGADDSLQFSGDYLRFPIGGFGLDLSQTATGMRIGMPDTGLGPLPPGAVRAYDGWIDLVGEYSNWDTVIRLTGDGGGELVLIPRVSPAVVTGGDGADGLTGGWHHETLSGGDGQDTIAAGGGNDLLYGGNGTDLLAGERGNDTLYGGDGTDTLNGGAEDDFLFGGSTNADLRDVIYGGDGNDHIDGGAGNDLLYGGTGTDTIAGGLGSDTLIGYSGDDVLAGGGGADLLYGGYGANTLNGGFGYDRLNGGEGADVFYHLGIADHGSDWIQDYRPEVGDILQIGIAGARASDFQVNFAHTPGAGSTYYREAFVIYRPTGQILWAIVDGEWMGGIRLDIGTGIVDLLA